MSGSNIAIVVVTYNRPNSLERLLKSIGDSNYFDTNSIDLIISCDNSGSHKCKDVAKDFIWGYGQKKVLVHDENLGLKKHILFCGDLVKDYDGIIMLEDDLWVAPNFYQYVVQANEFFADDERVAQISLYNFSYDEISYSPFIPLKQSADNFFMQIPSSWGQYWSKKSWFEFRLQLDCNELEINPSDFLPGKVLTDWPDSSWKKHFYKYLTKNNLYVVYPYDSLTTNFGDAGTHFVEKFSLTQARLDYLKTSFKFVDIDNSEVIYDYHYELHRSIIRKLLNGQFYDYEIEFDINGQKDIFKVNTPYLVSSKSCRNPIQTFGNELIPQEINILSNISGGFYSLGKTEDFSNNKVYQEIKERNIQFLPPATVSEIERKVTKYYESMLIFKLRRKALQLFKVK